MEEFSNFQFDIIKLIWFKFLARLIDAARERLDGDDDNDDDNDDEGDDDDLDGSGDREI